MKRTLVFLASATLTACFLCTADAVPYAFDFTISASATDPYVNSGPVTGGESHLYLWLLCEHEDQQGTMAMTAGFSIPDGSANLGFSTTGFPTLNAGDEWLLLMAIGGCPMEPTVLGEWTVLDLVPGGYCLTPDGNGQAYAVTDCDQLGGWSTGPVYQIGYAAGGVSDCPLTDGFVCLPAVSVEPENWGRLKSLYR